MKKLTIMATCLLVLGAVCVTPALADTSLQETVFVLNNGAPCDSALGCNSIAGLNLGSYNTTTGLGTLTFTYNPGAAGNYSYVTLLDLQAGVQFFNEFANTSGTLGTGESYQVDDPNFGTIYNNTLSNTLDNTNHITGGASNFDGSCVGANCNGDVSVSLGQNFSLTATEQEVITITVSHTQPTSGFFVEQIHPVDPSDPTENDIFFSLTAQTQPASSGGGGTGMPEPSTMLLLGLGLAGAALKFRR